VAQRTTCDENIFDVRCPVSNSVWSGSLHYTGTSTSEKPPPLCLKLSRSLSVLPGTEERQGCVQLVGVLMRGVGGTGTSVIGHYCHSHHAINLVLPVGGDNSIQPELFIGYVRKALLPATSTNQGSRLIDEIEGRFYGQMSNDPDAPFSPHGSFFSLKRIDACQTN
jgi:hypothetical protein